MAGFGDIAEPDPSVLGKLVSRRQEHTGDARPFCSSGDQVRVWGIRAGLGLVINHCMFDGVGAMQFVNSCGETARGVPLSLLPALDRAVLRARDPPQVAFPHHKFAQIADEDDSTGQLAGHEDVPHLHRSFRFTPESIARVKALVQRMTAAHWEAARACTFAALAGLVWSAGTRALGMGPARQSKLLFAVDGWLRFSLPPPPGYFGNAIVLTSTAFAAGELALAHAVRLVRRAADFMGEGLVVHIQSS